MFKLSEYTEYRDDTDPAYLGGKAVDTPDGDSVDGTQYDRRFFNQAFGFFQSVMWDAYEVPELSGHPDSIDNPEILTALKVIIKKITDGILMMLLETIENLETETALRNKQYNNLLNTINGLTTRLAVVESGLYNDVTTNPFEITFNNLNGIILISGIWNEPMERIECTFPDDLINITFKPGNNFVVLQGVYNTELHRVES
jgi:hypothetical protein